MLIIKDSHLSASDMADLWEEQYWSGQFVERSTHSRGAVTYTFYSSMNKYPFSQFMGVSQMCSEWNAIHCWCTSEGQVYKAKSDAVRAEVRSFLTKSLQRSIIVNRQTPDDVVVCTSHAAIAAFLQLTQLHGEIVQGMEYYHYFPQSSIAREIERVPSMTTAVYQKVACGAWELVTGPVANALISLYQ